MTDVKCVVLTEAQLKIIDGALTTGDSDPLAMHAALGIVRNVKPKYQVCNLYINWKTHQYEVDHLTHYSSELIPVYKLENQ